MDHPLQLRCPISLDLLKIPVIAGDGHTYENECIKHFLSRVARWPIKGPMGIDIPNANLVLNRNLFDALTTYREENRMASISLLDRLQANAKRVDEE